MEAVEITLYQWAGQWGPFRVNIPCGECSLTHDIIQDALDHQLATVPTKLTTVDWLSNWWKPLHKGGWHAPIVMVNNRIISQGIALNRGILVQAVINAFVTTHAITGSHLFGKNNCPHCQAAKQLLTEHQIPFVDHDVIKEEADLYEMVGRVKPIIGEKTPITVPQIWLNGRYIGGHDALAQHLQESS